MKQNKFLIIGQSSILQNDAEMTLAKRKKKTLMISGLYYKNFMIVIYDRNDSGQYYKTTITIVFTIRAKAKASLSENRNLRS